MALFGKSTKIGGAHVEVTADTTQAKQEINKVEGRLKGAGDAATRFQGILSKILIPVAAASSIAAVAKKVEQMVKEVRALEDAFQRIGRSGEAGLSKLAGHATDAGDITQQALEKMSAIDERLAAEQETRYNTLYGALGIRALFTGRTLKTLERQADEAKRKIGLDARQAAAIVSRIREQEEADKKAAENAKIREDMNRAMARAAELETQEWEEQNRILNERLDMQEELDRRQREAHDRRMQEIRQENEARIRGEEELIRLRERQAASNRDVVAGNWQILDVLNRIESRIPRL